MKRCFDEAHRLGRELAASPDFTRAELAAELVDLDRYFEVPQSAEEEAMHTFLGGLIAVLEDEPATWPSNGDGNDDD